MRFPAPIKTDYILLSITDPQELKELYARAYAVKPSI